MSAATPPPYPPGPGTPDDPGAHGAAGAPVPVPEELAVAPPGAVLAGMLEDVDVERVSGHDTVEVMLAEYRLMCRQQARFYRAVLETGSRKPFSITTVDRVSVPGEFAAEEARAALVWSRTRAERAFGFALDIFCRLPVLGEAMLAGRLDEPRARAFIDWTSGLTDAQAATVCDRLLPEAPALMVGELIDRIKRACLAIDPDWAEKRYREAVRTRRVQGSRNPDGTANLGGYSQPVDRIAAAAERIDALARACKRAGDRRKIDLIRSDLFLGMTDGTFEGMAEDEIIAYVLAQPYVEPGDAGSNGGGDGGSGDGEPGDTTGGPGGPWGGDGPGGGAPDHGGRGRPASAAASSDSDGTRGQPARGAAASSEGDGTRDELTDNRRPAPEVPADVLSAGGSFEIASGGASTPEAGRSATRWATAEVRIELATLLGIDEHPAEIPPWGYVPAAQARQLVADMHSAEWRYVFCDPAGRALAGGLIRARPATNSGGEPARRNPRRGGIVENRGPSRPTRSHRRHPTHERPLGTGTGRTGQSRRTTRTRPRHRPQGHHPAYPRSGAAPLDRAARSAMRPSLLPSAGPHHRPRPPRRLRPGRGDRRGEPVHAVPARPPPQGRGRLGHASARTRSHRVDQPARPPL